MTRKNKYGETEWDVDTLAAYCKERQEYENDFTIMITGDKGMGKSTLALLLAKKISPDFTFQKNMVITPDAMSIANSIDAAGMNPAVVADEAIGNLYCENWNDKAQKGLHIYLNQFQRKSKHAVLILCLPKVHDLRGPLRRSGIDLWIRLYQRGEGACLIKSAFDEDDPFRIWEIKIKRQKVSAGEGYTKTWEEFHPSFQRRVYGSLSTFLSTITWGKLPEQDYKEYLQYYESQKDMLKDAIFKGAREEQLKSEGRELRVIEKRRKLGLDASTNTNICLKNNTIDTHTSRAMEKAQHELDLCRSKLNLFSGEKRKRYLKRIVSAKNKLNKLHTKHYTNQAYVQSKEYVDDLGGENSDAKAETVSDSQQEE